MNPTRIEALWYEEGTAADAAAAANMNRPLHEHVSAAWVRSKWSLAQKEGRLPPFARPVGGFPEGPRSIVKRFAMVMSGRAA